MKGHLSSHISPIELAKTIRSIKGTSKSDADFTKLLQNLVPEAHQERIKQILSGTEQEDEFAIFCKVMGTCTSLNRIDQNPLIKSDSIAPDFIGTFSPKSPLKNWEKGLK